MILDFPYFGQLDSTNLEDYYDLQVEHEQHKFQIDLNFEETSIADEQFFALKNYLSDIDEAISAAKKAIAEDFADGEEVNEYLAFHLEECEPDELEPLLVNADKNLSTEAQLVSILKIKRIGIYPNDDNYAVLDFTIDEDVTQYILVVNLDAENALNYITMES